MPEVHQVSVVGLARPGAAVRAPAMPVSATFMSANHLILGLGGTGGKIIRSFRKTIYQKFRKENPAGVNIGYLYVDSSKEMMDMDDPSWKILGVSVQLNKKSQLLLQGEDLGRRLDNMNEFPGIKPWIGPPEQWKDILGSIIGVTLGGQKRRLGRFLFACKAADFRNQVQGLVRDLQASGTLDLTFHVVAGLAGGTGSGSIIDILSQLRNIYPDSKRYPIITYSLLPETYPNPNWDTGNYHANGFAALLEMNALSVRRYQPVDVSGIRAERLSLMDPFNGAYVFTNENDNGLTADVDKEIPNIVADFLYQKIVAAGSVSWPTLGRMENAENGDGSPEKSPGTNNPERSKRFLTFGIKRLAIPEEEIGEYLTYNFARQSALQLRYNNWSDTAGFADDSKNIDFSEFVRQKETLNKWALSDDHLTLSVGILPEDANNKKWKAINDEWQEVMPHFKSLVREKRQETWLSELQKLCEKRFDQDYRGVGVRTLYRNKLKAKKEIVAQVRRLIEDDLIADWKNGVRSTYDLSKLLTSLLDSTGEGLQAMDGKIVQMGTNEEDAANRVDANNKEWSHISLLGKLIGKPENMLNAQGDALFQQYVYRTRAEAWTFAKQITEELIVELNDLKAQIDQVTSIISEAVKKYNERIAQRITDKGPDLREQLVRFYNPELVRNITRGLVRDENEQRTQTNKVRLALIGMLGENPTFSLFNQRLGVSDFIDVLDTQSATNARIAHNNLVQNPKERLLNVSIFDKLRERFGGNPQELKSYLTELVAHAGNYASLDRSEMDKDRGASQTAVRQLTIILPAAPEQQEFVNTLKELFRGASPGNVEFVASDGLPNEIILVNLTNLFPLRYLKQLGCLKEKYDLRVSGGSSVRAKLELHSEGDGAQFPKLFIPAQNEVGRETIPYLLLASALKLVQSAPNPNTGSTELVFVSKDADGFDTEPIYLGKTLSEAGAKIDRRSADLVRDYVEGQLNTRDNMVDTKRAELRQAILASVEAIKAERGNNIQDETYKQYLDGGKKAVAIIKRDA
jgi:hypothetical protein